MRSLRESMEYFFKICETERKSSKYAKLDFAPLLAVH
jgi:hypothetical protein